MHVERIDLLMAIGLVAFMALLLRYKPTVDSIHTLVEMANSKGGIILILWITSMGFFMAGVRMVYWAVGEQIDGKLTVDNALIVACFSFITGSAFGGSFGAMIKTMTGETVQPGTTSKTETNTPPAIPPTP